jgi:hypothetical protein
MDAIIWIAIWGLVAVLASVVGGILAAARNRDHSSWAAWCFVLPPLLIVLALMPARKGARPRQPTLDEEDQQQERSML